MTAGLLCTGHRDTKMDKLHLEGADLILLSSVIRGKISPRTLLCLALVKEGSERPAWTDHGKWASPSINEITSGSQSDFTTPNGACLLRAVFCPWLMETIEKSQLTQTAMLCPIIKCTYADTIFSSETLSTFFFLQLSHCVRKKRCLSPGNILRTYICAP